MKIVEVIESKCWKNKLTNQTASIFGAVPYSSDTEKSQWIIEKRGYTWKMDNGTIGFGRMPVKTLNEAIEVMNNFNKEK